MRIPVRNIDNRVRWALALAVITCSIGTLGESTVVGTAAVVAIAVLAVALGYLAPSDVLPPKDPDTRASAERRKDEAIHPAVLNSGDLHVDAATGLRNPSRD